jgi:hypothetical protein
VTLLALANWRHRRTASVYCTLELPGKHPLKDAHAALDQAVLAAVNSI